MRIPNVVLNMVQKLEVNKGSYSRDCELRKIYSRCQENGIRYLGEGAYSSVIQHPTQPALAIKITLSKVDGYHRFVDWVTTNYDTLPKDIRRHLPKIVKTQYYTDGSRITITEKLRRYPKDNREISDRMSDSLEKAQRIVFAMGDAYGLKDDLSDNDRNTLYRGNTPVINDPWSHRDHHNGQFYI